MAYTVHLSQFEGPLDLLLYLIHDAKIDICDIFLSQITEEYLASIEDLSELDMDTASEFLAMAATLLEIKSRALLPKPPREETEEESPEQALIRRLEEYAALKEGVTQMQAFEQAASRMFEKLPEEIPLPPPIFELPNLTLEGLMEAFRRAMQRAMTEERGEKPARRLPRDTFTVSNCMLVICTKVHKGPCPFEALFSEEPTRDEIVTLFMALLELLKLGKITAAQDTTFGEIIISERTNDGQSGDLRGD